MDRYQPGKLDDTATDADDWLEYIGVLLDEAHDHYESLHEAKLEEIRDGVEEASGEAGDLELTLRRFAKEITN